MKKANGNLFIISAPSGAGKTTLCRSLTEDLPDIRLSVSYTTRIPRRDEINDKDYTFIDEKEFCRMIDHGDFIEWAKVHNHYYGTSGKRLEDMLRDGIDTVLDIDVQGAKQMRKNYSKGIYIFILPPSIEILIERLNTRMTNSPEDIKVRMKRSGEEIREYKNYDYVIINDDFYRALTELKAIVISDRLRTDRSDIDLTQNFNIQEG